MRDITKAIAIIKKYEGCRLTAYKCPAGVYTIGYGHTKGVKKNDKITQEKAEEYLQADLVRFMKNIDKYDKTYHFTNNEYCALLSFAFNLGSIDQLTAHGTRSKKTIASKMLLYVNCNGKPLRGLINRRRDEFNLFNEVE